MRAAHAQTRTHKHTHIQNFFLPNWLWTAKTKFVHVWNVKRATCRWRHWRLQNIDYYLLDLCSFYLYKCILNLKHSFPTATGYFSQITFICVYFRAYQVIGLKLPRNQLYFRRPLNSCAICVLHWGQFVCMFWLPDRNHGPPPPVATMNGNLTPFGYANYMKTHSAVVVCNSNLRCWMRPEFTQHCGSVACDGRRVYLNRIGIHFVAKVYLCVCNTKISREFDDDDVKKLCIEVLWHTP